MHDRDMESKNSDDDLRAGIRVSSLSIVWTVASSAAAVVVALSSGSLVLLAFGLTGLLDAAGSVALVAHFRHAVRHDSFSAGRERLAHTVVNVGLLVVGVTTMVESIRRLVDGTSAGEETAGIVIAAASVFVLAALSRRKLRIAKRIPSRALLADSRLTAVGCLIGVTTVAGTALTSAFGWWWLDPVAAMAVAAVAFAVVIVGSTMLWTTGTD